MSRLRWPDLLCLALVAVASWLAFSRILGWYFLDVDSLPLVATGRVRSLDDLTLIFSRPLMLGLMPNALFFRPVASISWGIDERIWGMRPYGYHLTNLLLHTANALSLFLVTRSGFLLLRAERAADALLDARSVSLGAALLFAVSPMQVEFVPATARRPDLLAALFCSLTLLLLFEHLRRPTPAKLALSAAACFLGLASKEIGIVVPFAAGWCIVVALASRERRPSLGALLRYVWPFVAVTIGYAVWRTLVLGGIGGYAPGPAPSRALQFLLSAETALLVLLWPGDLNASSALLLPIAPYVGGAALVVLGSVCCHAAWRWWRGSFDPLLGWLAGCILFLALLPLATGSVLPRQMYLHTLFFSTALAWASWTCVRHGSRWFVAPPHQRRSFASLLWRLVLLGAAGASMAASPLFGFNEYLERWRRTGEITRATLEGAERLLREVEPGTTLFLVNFPYQLDFATLPGTLPQPEAPMLLEHSVQGFLDWRFPSKRFDAVGLTYVELTDFGLGETNASVAFDRRRGVLDISVEPGALLLLFPWRNDYGRHDYRRIIPYARVAGDRSRARLLLSQSYLQRGARFLVFTGGGVELLDYPSGSAFMRRPNEISNGLVRR